MFQTIQIKNANDNNCKTKTSKAWIFFLGLKEAFIGLSVLDSALYAPPLPVTNELADAKAHAQ